MASSRAQICWALVSFGGGVLPVEGDFGEESGLLLSAVVSCVFEWAVRFAFFRQSCAMWPCSQHRKHRPSLVSCAHSSGVSFLNFIWPVTLSTSMGTMPELFEFGWAQVWAWVFEYVPDFRGVQRWFPVSPTLYFSLAQATSIRAAAFHSSMVRGIRLRSKALLWTPLLKPSWNLNIVPSEFESHPAASSSQSNVAIYVSISQPFMVSHINCSYAFCFFDVSVQASWKAVSNSLHRTSLSSRTQLFWLVSVHLASCFSCSSTQSLIKGPRMYVSAVSTLSKGKVIASCVRFTILKQQNCAQNSSVQLHVPSKIMGGTPLIPPLAGGFIARVVVVMFTDMGFGGSSGKGPCKDTIGSSVAANVSSRGPGAAIGWSLLSGIAVAGPQVSAWFNSDPDSEMIGDGFRGAVRSVVCTWMTCVVWLFRFAGSFTSHWPNPTLRLFGSIRYDARVPNIHSVREKWSMYHASLMNLTGTGSWLGSS